ncbi:MAG: phage holin family protein [Proteobacteria bacterium]|nr:phage holin family protein [Pseudomonadota bacterium]
MTEEPASDHAAEGTPPGGPIGVIRGLFVSVLEAARTRLDLAAVEAEIFLLRTIQMLLWAFAAVACGLLALAFVVVAVVAALWDTHRMLGVLGGAGLFLVLMGLFGYIASRSFRSKPHMLAGTLEQLETDQHRVSGAP